MKRLYRYEELDETAKKNAVHEMVYLDRDIIEWQFVYDDMHEYIRYLCKESGFEARATQINDWNNGLGPDTEIIVSDYRKVLGNKLEHLYDYVHDDLSDGYLEVTINSYREEVEVSFDYSMYKDTEEMLDINKRYHDRIDLEYFQKYSFYELIATTEEVAGKYAGEIESDFRQIGEYFSEIIEDKIGEKYHTLHKKIKTFIRGTFEYYEGEDHIRDSLEDKGSWLEENYRFIVDGTPVEHGVDGVLKCSECDVRYDWDEIAQTEKNKKKLIVCTDCQKEETLEKVI